jgi:hypothetical protein
MSKCGAGNRSDGPPNDVQLVRRASGSVGMAGTSRVCWAVAGGSSFVLGRGHISLGVLGGLCPEFVGNLWVVVVFTRGRDSTTPGAPQYSQWH